MPAGTIAFASPKKLGSSEPVKVRTSKRIVHEGKSYKAGDTFLLPEWQAKWWLTFPDPGIEIVRGVVNATPPKPEVKDDTQPDKSRGKRKPRKQGGKT